jgi:hypothetical protein
VAVGCAMLWRDSMISALGGQIGRNSNSNEGADPWSFRRNEGWSRRCAP